MAVILAGRGQDGREGGVRRGVVRERPHPAGALTKTPGRCRELHASGCLLPVYVAFLDGSVSRFRARKRAAYFHLAMARSKYAAAKSVLCNTHRTPSFPRSHVRKR